MATGVATWSTTAASNATADSSVNWAEGQAPSSINDSARAEMASVAKWRDDISGTITTAGTSTAYTATSNQSFASLSAMNGQIICIIPHATSGADPTLAVDGLTAKQIRTATGVNVPTGTLVQGTPYQLVYYSSAGEFILMGFAANPYLVPIGALLDYSASTAPNSSFVLPYGQAVSRTTYATYFAMVSTTFGVGDGSTTFNVPDLRGRVVAGLDNMGGSSANRLTNADDGLNGDTLGATGGGETQVLVTGNLPAYTPAGTVALSMSGSLASNYMGTYNGLNSDYASSPGNNGSFRASTVSFTGSTATFTGTAQGGTSTAFGVVQPTIVLPKILRII